MQDYILNASISSSAPHYDAKNDEQANSGSLPNTLNPLTSTLTNKIADVASLLLLLEEL